MDYITARPIDGFALVVHQFKMKRFVVFVACILAASSSVESFIVNQTVIAAINKSYLTLNTTLYSLNASFALTEQYAPQSLSMYVSNFNNRYLPLQSQYSNNGRNPIQTTLAASLVTDMCNANTALKTMDTVYKSAMSVAALSQVAALNKTLIVAANNMQAIAATNTQNGTNCLATYGVKLAGPLITVDRLTACVNTESVPMSVIAENISVLASAAQFTAVQLLTTLSVCSPVANATASNPNPSNLCQAAFTSVDSTLSGLSSVQSNLISTIGTLYQTSTYRMQRCINLVGLDILGWISIYTNQLTNCLTTGK